MHTWYVLPLYELSRNGEISRGRKETGESLGLGVGTGTDGKWVPGFFLGG